MPTPNPPWFASWGLFWRARNSKHSIECSRLHFKHTRTWKCGDCRFSHLFIGRKMTGQTVCLNNWILTTRTLFQMDVKLYLYPSISGEIKSKVPMLRFVLQNLSKIIKAFLCLQTMRNLLIILLCEHALPLP